MKISIKILTPEREKEWDEFIHNREGGRFSFLTGYKKVVEETFGYIAKYFIFEKDNKIVGVFPSFLAGKKLMSVPFGVYGGLLGSFGDSLDKKALDDFFNKRKEEFPKIEVNGVKNDLLRNSLESECSHHCALLELGTRSEEALWDSFDYAVRKNIKKAQDFGVEVFQDNSKQAIEKWFYPLYLREMKMFGTPPYPLKFFLNFSEFLSEELKVFFAKTKDGKVVANLFGIGCQRQNFYIHFNPSWEKYRYQRPNDLLHWEMIKQAKKDGYSFFDFGPMKYEGQKRFKEKWGIKKIEYWQYSSDEIKSGKVQGQKVFSFVWKYLMPNFLAQRIGPIIRKKLVK